MIKFFAAILRPFLLLLDLLTPLADLAARCWVAWMFFKSGLVKVEHWQSTLSLFRYEYHVPLLTAEWAAGIGTAVELTLPVLLVFGFGGRITILLFFIYNVVAVISYDFLWTPDGWSGLAQHINWALILALLMTHGPGKLSIDYWIRKRFGKRFKMEHKHG